MPASHLAEENVSGWRSAFSGAVSPFFSV